MREHIAQIVSGDTVPQTVAVEDAIGVSAIALPINVVFRIASLIDHIDVVRSENASLRAGLDEAKRMMAESVQGLQQVAEEMAALRAEAARIKTEYARLVEALEHSDGFVWRGLDVSPILLADGGSGWFVVRDGKDVVGGEHHTAAAARAAIDAQQQT